MDASLSDPAAQVDLMHRRCRKFHTPCGDGRMVWRVWGQGDPVVLLHGGSGSWTHWFRTIPALEDRYTVIVADLPGCGDSDMPVHPYDRNDLIGSTDRIAEIMAAGLREIVPATAYHLVGFSFGAVSGGYVALREGSCVRSFTTIGAAAMGIPWPGLTGSLRVVEPGMSAARILDVQRHNLNVIMMAAAPCDIDDMTAWLQWENTKRARLRTHWVAPSDTLARALRRLDVPLTAIWGLQDVFVNPGAEEREKLVLDTQPAARVHFVDGAGHWAMYEAADAVNELLLSALDRASGAAAVT